MAKYRKKPVTIEAWQFRADHVAPHWILEAMHTGAVWYQGGKEPYLTIKTLEGEMRASTGDWIIRGVAGEICPCKPDIFEQTYELVSEAG